MMNSRGYAAIGLHNPKDPANVGGAMRAATVYGAGLLVLGGPRPKHYMGFKTDTTRAWRNIPTVFSPHVLDSIPYDCIPIAVDLVPGARSLVDFQHPDRAFYVFGPEDGTLGHEITDRCAYSLFVPTPGPCMNLAATVNVVLYDRLAKGTFRHPRVYGDS